MLMFNSLTLASCILPGHDIPPIFGFYSHRSLTSHIIQDQYNSEQSQQAPQ